MKVSLKCMSVVFFLFLPEPPFSIPPYLYYFMPLSRRVSGLQEQDFVFSL